MELGHLETNFQRLLVKCEELAENQNSNNWRFDEVTLKSMNETFKISSAVNVISVFIVCQVFGATAEKAERSNS